jgi:hypothetical protein
VKVDDELILLSVAEIYTKSNILNVLRVDFDTQILDDANKKIIKATKSKLSCDFCCSFYPPILSRCISDLLEEFKTRCDAANVKASLALEESGRPGNRICEVADQLNVDTVVMGHRGVGALQRAFMGSTSEYCVKNCKVGYSAALISLRPSYSVLQTDVLVVK